MEGECLIRGECSIQAGEYTEQGEWSMLNEEEAGSMLEEGEDAVLKEGGNALLEGESAMLKGAGESEGEGGDSGEEDEVYEEEAEDEEDNAGEEDEEGAMLEGAGAMQLEMVTSTPSTISTGASRGKGDNTGMASILDLMTGKRTFSLDRKVDMELALLEALLASLRKERLELEEDAERSTINLPSTALLDDLVASMRKEKLKVEVDDVRLAANSPSQAETHFFQILIKLSRFQLCTTNQAAYTLH